MAVFEEFEATEVPLIKGCLIYFLIKNGEVVYVGQTKNGLYRPFSHYDKDFDKVYVLSCKEEGLDIVEDYYILKYQPIYNKKITDGYTLITSRNKLRRTLNDRYLTIKDIKRVVKNNNLTYIKYGKNLYLNNETILMIHSILEKEKNGSI